MPKTEVQKGSANVFADLGLPEAGAELAKAELARQISHILDERGLTQTQAAEILGVDQAKVSVLVRGKLAGFSTDRLFKFLNALDRDVEIVVRPKKRLQAASVRVLEEEPSGTNG